MRSVVGVIMVLVCLLATRSAHALERLAVLELQAASLSAEERSLLTDTVRGAVVGALPSSVRVMTRENMEVMLTDMGLDASCVAEGACEVETARNLGVDYVVSGTVVAVSNMLVVSLKLHETSGGALLASRQQRGDGVLALMDALPAPSQEVVAGLAPAKAVNAQVSQAPAPTEVAVADIAEVLRTEPTVVPEIDQGPWAKRSEPTSLRKAISAYEAAWNTSRDSAIATRQVRAYLLLAQQDEPSARQHLDNAMQWSERCLGTSLQKKVRANVGAIIAAGTASPACMAYAAFALDGRSRLVSIAQALKFLKPTDELIQAARSRDLNIGVRAPDRFTARRLAGLPTFAGQDLKQSRALFDSVRTAVPGYLPVLVEQAVGLEVISDNRAQFTALLQEVLATTPAAGGAYAPENRVAQRRAEELLGKANTLFGR